MADHRRTLGESGRGYPCYVLKPPKIALVVVSGTQSPAAIDGFRWQQESAIYGRRRFLCARPLAFFQVHRGQKSPRPARCTLSAPVTESPTPQLDFVLQVWCTLTQIRPIFSVQLIINA